MILWFSANVNKNYCCIINAAIFHLKKGGAITIEYEDADYEINGDRLRMFCWHPYLWQINGVDISEYPECYLTGDAIKELFEDATVELIKAADTDPDYQITDIKFHVHADAEEEE